MLDINRLIANGSFMIVILATSTAISTEQVFDLTPANEPAIISDQLSDTNKVKILRMPDGTLISVYGQARNVGREVYDLKARGTRDSWGLVTQYSTDEGKNWSATTN